MKKFIAILAAAIIVLLLASPVLAASLGISPSSVELEVPGNGSATANFQVHYFSGELKVSLVDIPLRVEPETIDIEPSSEPVDIVLTIYGDDSLGSQVYDGYIRFLGMSGGTVAVAIKVKAKVTNIVAGQPVPEEPSPEETPAEETTGESEQSSPTPSESSSFPVLPVAGIAAGTVIVITLIIVFARRAMY